MYLLLYPIVSIFLLYMLERIVCQQEILILKWIGLIAEH